MSNFLQATAAVLGYAIDILWWLIVIRALLSWVNPDPYNPIVQFIERSTEWFLAPFRRLIPAFSIGFDLSPLLAIFFLYFLRIFAIKTLLEIATRL